MNVIFRTDASLQVGTGHVMRCLTFADVLKAQGAECQFICREHPGNLIEHIKEKGYQVHVLACALPADANLLAIATSHLAHAAWLGVTQEQDAGACAEILRQLQTAWLIVDHYALDACWEKALQPYYRKLMVIDDLADRPHSCDVLLDQTFGRNPQDYQPWVSSDCILLCGSKYALLRPEFAALRPHSLKRREQPQLEHLLITMGGVDNDNATGLVLQALKGSELPLKCRITVVMGGNAKWLDDVRQQAQLLPWPTEVRVNVSDMAHLMADSDLAIGAAGSTSWERCCLGLPSIMMVLADNQMLIARSLHEAKAASLANLKVADHTKIEIKHLMSPQALANMSVAAAHIVDGLGAARVTSCITGIYL